MRCNNVNTIGEPSSQYTSKFDVDNTETHTLPTPFTNGGEECCDRISETVEQLVFLDDSWYTLIAPVTVTTSDRICWSTITYEPAIVEIVPTYGQVKLLDSSRVNGSATFNQRGIGARFEHGFMAEPKGKQCFAAALQIFLKFFIFYLMEQYNVLVMQRRNVARHSTLS